MYWFKKIKLKLLAVAAVLAVGLGTGCDMVFALTVPDQKFVLVIDPGHGGNDAGACDNGQKEKDINLAVGKALSQLVKKKLKDVEVVMTRADDTYLTLQQRATLANRAKGDLFVSIHTNSVDKTNKNRNNVSGTSVYTLGLHKDNSNMEVARRENSVIELESNYEQRYSGFDPAKDESYIIFEMAQKKNLHNSIRFAKMAQNRMVQHASRKDRGVHQAGFWVLWATSMPAVLVELDFICNPTQAAYLGSSKGVKELSESLFEAVKDYVESRNQPAQLKAEQSTKESVTATTDDNHEDYGADAEVSDEDGRGGTTAMLLPTKGQSAEKVAEKVSTVKQQSDAPVRREEYAQRRRRSASSRQKSEARNLQTTEIPLHRADERMAVPVEEKKITSEQKLSAKEQAKRDKELKKAAEKARKEAAKSEREAKKKSKAKKGGKFQTIYKVQILASKEKLKPNNPRFKGLSPVSVFMQNNLYKYTVGDCTTKEEVNALLKQVKTIIPDAFIIETTCEKH